MGGSSSVLIADVDATEESELASKFGVSGYPTIKYFTSESGEKGEDYRGGREFDDLKKFVQDELERKCDVSDAAETCSEKEQKFIEKMKAKDDAALSKELGRLDWHEGQGDEGGTE